MHNISRLCLAHFWLAFAAFLGAAVLGTYQMWVRSPLADITRRQRCASHRREQVQQTAGGDRPWIIARALPKTHMAGLRAISCAARSRSGYAFDAAIACPRWLCSNTRNINACVMSNSGTIAVGMK